MHRPTFSTAGTAGTAGTARRRAIGPLLSIALVALLVFVAPLPALAKRMPQPEPAPKDVPPTSIGAAGPVAVQPSLHAPPGLEPVVVLQRVAVGKWPEGVAVVGDSAWVAVSGARQLARVDLRSGKVTARRPAGRLPVDLRLSPAGDLLVLAATDGRVLRMRRGNGALARFTKQPGFPVAIGVDVGALFILRWPDGSSSSGDLVRVALRDRRVTTSPGLGPNAFDLVMAHSSAWVARDNGVVAVDPTTMQIRREVALARPWRKIAPGRDAIYVGGISALGRVPMADEAPLMVDTPTPVSALHVEPGALVAGMHGGWLNWRDLQTLAPLAQQRLPLDTVAPQALASYGEKLLVTVHSNDPSQGGALLIVSQPGALSAKAAPASSH